MKNIHQHKILILDFGSQYTQLIARRVREAGVYSEVHPWDMPAKAIAAFAANGIILSGGPESVTEVAATARLDPSIFTLGIPVLGICYGMQAMATHFGGHVKTADEKEFGYANVVLNTKSALFDGIDAQQDKNGNRYLDVWMSHGDSVDELPRDFQLLAHTENAPIAAMGHKKQPFYGVQFHPEVTHTRQGQAMLTQFVQNICACPATWTTGNIIEEAIANVRAQVGTERVMLGLSGGVDSSVVAALLHQAIGDKLTCVFVDTGLLRLNEGDQVMQLFAENMGVNVIRVDAAEAFMAKLKGVNDPEQKRQIIGHEFIRIFEAQANQLTGVHWLAQGTIYPDVIESADSKTGKAKKIKSHHNVGGLPETMSLKLLEPLRELFKDEVRDMGIKLGLPASMVYRHPFPGPGLGVRILGEVTKTYADILRQADAIFIDMLRQYDLYDKVSQAFAVFLPVKSVGVVGDARQYDYVIALRAVETVDFMTASFAHLPHEFLGNVANRILNEVRGISRVTYDISGKPPATIEWE